jgi:tRNA(adenine34) deaminase
MHYNCFMSATNLKPPTNAAADVAFMELAIEQARSAAQVGEVPIGAVVVFDGAVVATGHNRRETDANPSAHAEFLALVEASRQLGRWRLTGCTVYVTLEPCLMCAGLMQLSRIDRCVYGAADPKGGALGTLYQVHCDERLNHNFEVTAGVCERECAELLSSFFAGLRDEKSAGRAVRRGDGTGQADRAEQAKLTGQVSP